jgi:hypothetical protein
LQIQRNGQVLITTAKIAQISDFGYAWILFGRISISFSRARARVRAS